MIRKKCNSQTGIQKKYYFELPWYKSMVCAIRLSDTLMIKIKEYVKENKELCFLEFFFNTLAEKNNLKIENPDELSSILYRNDWKFEDIKKTNLYHPIKKIDIQKNYREQINNII